MYLPYYTSNKLNIGLLQSFFLHPHYIKLLVPMLSEFLLVSTFCIWFIIITKVAHTEKKQIVVAWSNFPHYILKHWNLTITPRLTLSAFSNATLQWFRFQISLVSSEYVHGFFFLYIIVTLSLLMQFAGINGVLYYTPQILEQAGVEVLLANMGISSDSSSILISALTTLLMLPSIGIAMRLMDISGRRLLLSTYMTFLAYYAAYFAEFQLQFAISILHHGINDYYPCFSCYAGFFCCPRSQSW